MKDQDGQTEMIHDNHESATISFIRKEGVLLLNVETVYSWTDTDGSTGEDPDN